MKTYISFLASLVVTFALLCAMWVSAAHADTGCAQLPNGVTMCEGAAVARLSAPRGTVKHRPATSFAHRVQAAIVAHKLAPLGQRTGYTYIVARLGAR